jgi:hypothetical protein
VLGTMWIPLGSGGKVGLVVEKGDDLSVGDGDMEGLLLLMVVLCPWTGLWEELLAR